MSEHIYGTDGHEGHWLTGEEIVRCRDCRHYVDASCYVDKELHSCTHWGDWTTSDGFCAWGERRDA